MGELNLSTIAKAYSDEEAAYRLIESIRWPDGVVCPHCGTVGQAYFLRPKAGARKTSTGKASYRRLWKCAACRGHFSVRVGTLFESSKIPLSKWLLAIHEICSTPNGLRPLELQRKLGISYQSAWFLAHRVRYAMHQQPLSGMLGGGVETGETYAGEGERHASSRGSEQNSGIHMG